MGNGSGPWEEPATRWLEALRVMRYNRPPMPEQQISLMQVRHVAKLSRLAISEEQAQRYTAQIESILEYVDQINSVEMSGVEPMAHAVPLHNVLREDVAEAALPLDQVLQNAPDTDGPFFKVPKVIGGDEE